MARRCILAVYAHPDDETSGMGGAITLYVREGVDVHVVTATRGELGTLGTGGLVIAREELPAVREAELRAVLRSYGAHPPMMLDYRDQEVKDADFEELVGKVLAAMERVKPDVVVTFGPLGISRHDDHIAVHKATLDAFHRYRESADPAPRLFYEAIPKEASDQFELHLEGPEAEPNVFIDIREFKPLKLQALRSYRSQEDAQWLADIWEDLPLADTETFYQAYPPLPDGRTLTGFWPG